jgi:aerobic carbon-monoxide dehydrogenase medium subunit
MIPKEFDYHKATSVQEAISLLQEHGEDAKLLAGGHSLLPVMKLRLAAPTVLIDISKVAELKSIHANGALTIGAGATYAEIAAHEQVKHHAAVLTEAVAQIGDTQVRNKGTIGGALAHADPAADLPAVVLALGARIHVAGPNGKRDIAAEDFFVDLLTSALEPGEIITSISFAPLGHGEGAAYVKLPHPASRYAIVGVAAYVKVAGGNITAARVAVTGAGAKAERQPSVEQALVGQAATAETIAAAAASAGDGMDILSDIHAGEEYRRAQIKVYAKRALAEAVSRAQG